MVTQYLRATCFPDDNIIQKITAENTTWTMPRNPYGDRFTCFVCDLEPDYYRKVVVTYSNNIHKDIFKSIYSPFFTLTTPLTSIIMQNNVFINVSSGYGVVYSYLSGSVLLENNTYSDSEAMGSAMFYFQDAGKVIVNGLTHNNVNASETLDNKYIYFKIQDGGNFTTKRIIFENLNIGSYRTIFVEGRVNEYALSHLNYTNVEVGSENSMIAIKSFSHLFISN